MRDIIDELKAMSDLNRLRILSLLWEAEDLCGCEFENILDMRQSNTSRQLERLRTSGFLSSYKQAQWIHFLIAPEHRSDGSLLHRVIEQASRSREIFAGDIERLKDYRRRGFTCKTIGQWVPFEGFNTHTQKSSAHTQ
ncbi:MAG: metalloregulator ArsR/SmtB family transcription factor [Spirochaetia bacterium]|nr:metalloregulator ArsR/SmtB family transcription factor [Spirochaetia bacterium]